MIVQKKHLPEYCYTSARHPQPRRLDNPTGIVEHYFSAINVAPDRWDDVQACYDLFCDLNLPGLERGLIMNRSAQGRSYTSAHFLIARDGGIYELVPLMYQAYHAGASQWAGRDNLNEWTIGVEWIATATSGYTDDQYAASQLLHAQLISRFKIPLSNIAGHDQVAPGRKHDPGKLFDWHRFMGPLQDIV